MTDHLQKRSVLLAGHKTSLALEPPFWHVLAACAQEKGMSLAALISRIDAEKPLGQPLASAARLAALDYALGGSPTG